ncbi:MAG: PQQ-binding-like beta-propeller repeat protein [Acidobacteriota bacterium]
MQVSRCIQAWRHVYRSTLCLVTAGVVASCGPAPSPSALDFAGEWPQWRGPERNGHAVVEAVRWPDGGLREAWRCSVGPGFSVVSVAGGRLFTTGAAGGSEWLLALDAATGDELWRSRLGTRYESFHGDGPRSTPAVSGDVVVALGAFGDLAAFRVGDGDELWRVPLFEMSGGRRESWGFASSPLIDGDRVFVHGASGVSALAVSLGGGEILWQIAVGPGGYSSPRLLEIGGRRQLVSFLGAGLFGLEPSSGEILWRFDYTTFYDLHAADPVVVAPGQLFISSNYATGAALVAVEGGEARALWRNPAVRNHWSSSVLVDGTIYGFDKTFLVAVDPATGEVLWKQRGFGEGSLLALEGAGEAGLLISGEDGDIALALASPEAYEERGRGAIGIDGPVRTAPVLVSGLLFVRGKEEIVALRWDAGPS